MIFFIIIFPRTSLFAHIREENSLQASANTMQERVSGALISDWKIDCRDNMRDEIWEEAKYKLSWYMFFHCLLVCACTCVFA